MAFYSINIDHLLAVEFDLALSPGCRSPPFDSTGQAGLDKFSTPPAFRADDPAYLRISADLVFFDESKNLCFIPLPTDHLSHHAEVKPAVCRRADTNTQSPPR